VLFGQLVVENGGTVWKDGPATEAVRYGAVLLNDEWDVTPPEILFGFQWLFEDKGKLFLKEMPGDSESKFITPHDNFRMVCAGNTVGQGDDTGRYSGTNVQNNATIDRFQTTIVLDYLDAVHETKIIEDNCTGLWPGFANKMVSFANLVRTASKQNNINLTMSPRTLINWGRKAVVMNDMKRALVLSFVNKLRDTDRKIVSEFYTKVFGGTL
jgi:cobaltochelatase CobS